MRWAIYTAVTCVAYLILIAAVDRRYGHLAGLITTCVLYAFHCGMAFKVITTKRKT